MEVSLPGSSNCPSEPAGATPAEFGGIAGWRLTKTEPNDFDLTSDSIGVYFGGRCYTITGYFGPDNHDQSIFEQMISSVVFTSLQQ
jgi:hypothetical protein